MTTIYSAMPAGRNTERNTHLNRTERNDTHHHPPKLTIKMDAASNSFPKPISSSVPVKSGLASVKLSNKKDTGKGNKQNVVQYKNKHLWSKQSAELENMLKPLIVQSADYFPNYDALLKMPNGYEMGIIDTIASVEVKGELPVSPPPVVEPQYDTSTGELLDNTDNASEAVSTDSLTGLKVVKRDHVNRFFCHWSYFDEQFMFSKDICDKGQIGPTVITLINDFLTEQQEAEQAAFNTKVGFQYPNKLADIPKVAPSDGDFKCACIFKAVTSEGNVHVRPLCTSSDVVVAIYELLDPRIVKMGMVHLPHVYNNVFRRHSEGFYRFTYKLNRPGEWQYLKINLPSELHELAPYVCPSLCDAHLIMETTTVFDSSKVPKRLVTTSEQITKYMTEFYSAEQMITHMSVDFEALYKYEAPTSPVSSIAGGNSKMNSSINSQHSKSYLAKNVKNKDGGSISEHDFRFRVLQIGNLEFTERHAIHRRFALPKGLHKDQIEYLKNFNFFFKQEWKSLEKREKLKEQQKHFVELKKMNNLGNQLVERRRKAVMHDDIHLRLMETESHFHKKESIAAHHNGHRHSYAGVLSGVKPQNVPYSLKDDTNVCYVNAIGYAREQFETHLAKMLAKQSGVDDSSEEEIEINNPLESAENSIFQFASKDNRTNGMLLISDLLAQGKVATPDNLRPKSTERTTTIRRRANLKTGRNLQLIRETTEREKVLKAELDEIVVKNKALLDKYRHLMYVEEEVTINRKDEMLNELSSGRRTSVRKNSSDARSSAKPSVTGAPNSPRVNRSKSIRSHSSSSENVPVSPKKKLNNNKTVEETYTKMIEIARLEFINEYLQQINKNNPPTATIFDHNGMRFQNNEDPITSKYRKNEAVAIKLLNPVEDNTVDDSPMNVDGIQLEIPEEFELEDYIYRMTTIDEEAEESDTELPTVVDSSKPSQVDNPYYNIRHESTSKHLTPAALSFNYIKDFYDNTLHIRNSRINRRKAAHKLMEQHNLMIQQMEEAKEADSAERLEFRQILGSRQTPTDSRRMSPYSTASRDSPSRGSESSPTQISHPSSPIQRSGATSPVHMNPHRSTVDNSGIIKPKPKPIRRNNLTIVQDINKSLASVAFKLAEKMDTSYLFSKFDINHHVNRENEIVSIALSTDPPSFRKHALSAMFRESRRESSDVRRLHHEFEEYVDFKHQYTSKPNDSLELPAYETRPPTPMVIENNVAFDSEILDDSDIFATEVPQPLDSPVSAKDKSPTDEAPIAAPSFLEQANDLKLKYEQESDRMMDLLLAGLAPELANKIRKGMVNKAKADAYKRRMLYIMRRRDKEKISQGAVAILKEYYEYNKLLDPKFGDMTDSSSEEEEEEEEVIVEQVANLLGDYNMSEEAINALILQRIQEDLERQLEEERQRELELAHYEKLRLQREAAGRREGQLPKKGMGKLVTDALDRRLSIAKKRIQMCPEVFAAQQQGTADLEELARQQYVNPRMSMETWRKAMVNFQPPPRPQTSDSIMTSTTSDDDDPSSTRTSSRVPTASGTVEEPEIIRPDSVGGLLWGDSHPQTAASTVPGSAASNVHSTHSRIPSPPRRSRPPTQSETVETVDEFQTIIDDKDYLEQPGDNVIVEDYAAVCSNISRLIEELNLMQNLEATRNEIKVADSDFQEEAFQKPGRGDPLLTTRRENIKKAYNKFLQQHAGVPLLGDSFNAHKTHVRVKVSKPVPFKVSVAPIVASKESKPVVKSSSKSRLPVIGHHMHGEVGLLHKLPDNFYATGTSSVPVQTVDAKRVNVFNDLLSKEPQTDSTHGKGNNQIEVFNVPHQGTEPIATNEFMYNRPYFQNMLMSDDTPQSSRGVSRAAARSRSSSRSRSASPVKQSDSQFVEEVIQSGLLMFNDSVTLTANSSDVDVNQRRMLGSVTPVEGMRSIVEDGVEDSLPEDFIADHSIVSWVSENSKVDIVEVSAPHQLTSLGGSKWTPFFMDEVVAPPIESPVLVPKANTSKSPHRPKIPISSLKSPRGMHRLKK